MASVIVPVWNNEKYIGRCIQSIKEQSCNNFECFVVNDGSTDNSAKEAVKAIDCDKRFKLINQEHLGLSSARNLGLDASSSDFIFYVDADDSVHPQMIETALSFLNYHALDMAFFDAHVVSDEEANPYTVQERKYFTRKRNYGIGKGKQLLKEMMHKHDFVYAVFIQAARKSFIMEKFYPGLRAQDQLYTTENILLAENVGHLSEELYFKHCRHDSISHQRCGAHYVWSRMKSAFELIRFIERRGLQSEMPTIAPIISHMQNGIIGNIKCFNEEDFKWIETLPLEERSLLLLMNKISFNKPFIAQSLL